MSAASTSSPVGANTADTATEELSLIEKGKEPDLEVTPMNEKDLGKMKHEQKVKREG